MRRLFINSEDDMIKLVHWENGSIIKDSSIYHTNFKPTPTDIGALPLTGGNVERLSIINANSQGYIDLLNEAEGGTIRISSPDNSYVYEIDAFNNHQIRMHTATKHPSDVEAQFLSWDGRDGKLYLNSVPVLTTAGGTITGDLYHRSGSNGLLRLTSGNADDNGVTFAAIDAVSAATLDTRRLFISSGDDMLRLQHYDETGFISEYSFYSTYFKPTANDVGALPYYDRYGATVNPTDINENCIMRATFSDYPAGLQDGQGTIITLIYDIGWRQQAFISAHRGSATWYWRRSATSEVSYGAWSTDFLPLSGGTLGGELALASTTPMITFHDHASNRFCHIQNWQGNFGLYTRNTSSDKGTDLILAAETVNLADMLQLYTHGIGNDGPFKIYGQHNQPWHNFVATEITPGVNNQINWVYE